MDVHTLRVVSGSVTCNALCPHCAYHKGRKSDGEDQFDFQKFAKARQFATQSGAVAMEVEAKGDPLMEEWTRLYQILSEAGSDFPQIGLATPGDGILDARDPFLNLVGWHLTNITLTIPHHRLEKRKVLLGLNLDYKDLIDYLRKECHVVVRAACFLSKAGISSSREALDFVHWCRELGIQQVAFKELGLPDNSLNKKGTQWCEENAIELDFDENWNFDDPTNRILYVNSLVAQNQARPVFVFPWGETAYDVDGVNVVFEKSENNYYSKAIKSLLFSDNHLYARWQSEGTIIF